MNGSDPVLNTVGLESHTSTPDKVDRVLQLRWCQELVSNHLKTYHRTSDNYKKPSYQSTFAVGNLVFIKDQTVSETGYKLRFKFKGPYRVLDITGNVMIGQSLASGKLCKVSLRNVKIFHNENITLCESFNAQEPFPSIEGDLPGETSIEDDLHGETNSNLVKKDMDNSEK